MKNRIPRVSFIIPTFNSEKYIERCLDSVFSQRYPKNKYEVLVADGGSTDTTLKLLKKYKLTVLKNPQKTAESGKYIAYNKSRFENVVLLDSDNILASNNWLKRIVIPLAENPDLLGVESNYLIARDFSSINTYANLLVIADPLARILSSRPSKIYQKRNYSIK